jgi:hypothetical protein
MPELVTIGTIGFTFLLARCVKGVIGFGLPTVSLALLTATIGLQPAVALMLAPSFVTNLWQAMIGGNGRTVLVRTWPFPARCYSYDLDWKKQCAEKGRKD